MKKESMIIKKINLHKKKILLALFILLFSLSIFNINNTAVKRLERLDYLSDAEVGIVNDSTFPTIETFLKVDGNQGIVYLNNGDEIIQNYETPTQLIESISIYTENNLKHGKVKVAVKDGENIIAEKEYSSVDFNSHLILPLNNQKFSLGSDLTISLTVDDMTEDESLGLLSYQCVDTNFYVLNEKNERFTPEESQIFLTKTIGYSTFYHLKIEIILISVSLTLLLILIMLIFKEDIQIKNKISNIMDVIIKKRLQFVFEFAFSLILAFFILRFMIYYFYEQDFNVILYIIIFTLISIFSCYFIYLFIRYKNDLAHLFLLLAIPVGVLYLVFIFPDAIPDEPMHFYKTFLTSNLDFTMNNVVGVPSDYSARGIEQYNQYWNLLFSTSNYSTGLINYTPVQYSFILYLIPSFGIIFAKIFSLSVYMGYFLARMLNLITFLYLGYKTIKLTPIAKVIFFIYLFNPMVIHQTISLSADVLINSISILFIAYVLSLKFSNKKIEYKDILLILLFLLFTVLAKYLYLPLIGLLLIVFDKIRKVDIKKILFFLMGCIMVACIYYCLNILTLSTANLVVESSVENMISPIGQLHYILNNPFNYIMMLIQTVINKFDFYWFSFFGRYLSYLDWHVHVFPIILYIILFFMSPFFMDEKYKLKISSRIWLILISIILFILVITGLYLTWTPVGYNIAEGVQGRYFIPFAILFLISFSGKRYFREKYSNLIIIMSLIFIHLFVLINIMFIASGV